MDEGDPVLELLDESRAGERAAARQRERSLRWLAQEEASLEGTLVDLAERGSAVTVRSGAGPAHHGWVLGVGGDFCVVRGESGAHVYLRLDAVTTVRPRAGTAHPPATGTRRPPADRLLLEVLGRVVADRPRVGVVTRGGEAVAGELRSVGADVLTVALDGDPPSLCYVAGGAIAAVTVAEPGR
ncbi:MAG: hypothetical protein ACRDZ9_00545 [Acidimicrobiales bacterium]